MDPLNDNLNDESDFEWEHQKENIAQVREGRSARFLKQISDTNEYNNEVLQDHWIDKINQNPLSLDLWFDYVKWIEESYPSLGKKSNYTEAIETCTQTLVNHGYNNDMKFLKIWLKYVNISENPLEIFQFLNEKGIGTKFADFYIRWSQFLLKENHINEADEAMERGIIIKAQPLKKLKLFYVNFQKLMAQDAIQGIMDMSLDDDAINFEDDTPKGGRKVLGSLSGSSTNKGLYGGKFQPMFGEEESDQKKKKKVRKNNQVNFGIYDDDRCPLKFDMFNPFYSENQAKGYKKEVHIVREKLPRQREMVKENTFGFQPSLDWGAQKLDKFVDSRENVTFATMFSVFDDIKGKNDNPDGKHVRLNKRINLFEDEFNVPPQNQQQMNGVQMNQGNQGNFNGHFNNDFDWNLETSSSLNQSMDESEDDDCNFLF